MRHVKPWIQQTAVALIFTNVLLFMGHIEWWQPELGRRLNIPLLIYLILSTVGFAQLVDFDDPFWDEDDEDYFG